MFLKFHFVKYKNISFLVSVIISILSIILIYTRGINFNIEFTGGVNIEIQNKDYDLDALRKNLEKNQILGSVNLVNMNHVSIKAGAKSTDQIELNNTIERIKKVIEELDSQPKYLQVEAIGPQMGEELIKSGVLAVGLAFVGIMTYVAFRFEWQFGIGVLVALMHDALISLGFASLTQIEFNISSIAAILTIIGYSVNDSIVVYDRIRENIRIVRSQNLPDIINNSIIQTLSRTTLTVFTTIIANLALVLFGGEAIFPFAILVLFGFIFGTYSSIFVSAPFLLVLIDENKYLNRKQSTPQ